MTMTPQNNIVIDNHQLSFNSGETILETARRNNIHIPTLCYLKGTTPSEKCGICVVEIQGPKKLVPSCSTPAASGMVIYTESKKVTKERRSIIRTMLSSGNHNCAIRDFNAEGWTEFQFAVLNEDRSNSLCPAWGDCRLQDLAYRYQVNVADSPHEGSRFPMERVNPFILRDFSRCILCGRCVKACREKQVNNAIDFISTENGDKIAAGSDVALKDSDCVFCGECIEVCPVGALVPQNFLEKKYFVKTEKIKTTCGFCGVGCQLELNVQNNRIVKINSAGEDTAPNFGSLCVKGRFGYDFVSSLDRITSPMIRKNKTLEKVTWDEALDFAAENLNRIKKNFGSDSIGLLTSARTTNEDNYIAQKFTRAVLKTNNIDHCARL